MAFACLFVPLTTVSLSNVPKHKAADATGLNSLFRQMGGAVGIAIFASFIDNYAKLARGGLVDAEFLAHYLQLRDHVALDPSIQAALAGLVSAGKLDPAIRLAHRTLARFLIASRLLAPDGTEPDPGARAVLASACECDDWRCLTEKLTESRRTVADAWAATFGETLEIA